MQLPTHDPALSSSSSLALAHAPRGLHGRLQKKSKLLLCLLASLAGFALIGVDAQAQSSVVQWGYPSPTPPALPPGLSYVEVATGGSGPGSASGGFEPRHSLARLSDGSVVAWGSNNYGQCNVPALPPGLTYVEIAASGDGSVARLSDGSVVAWGDNSHGQCNVPVLPPGLSYVEVATGGGPYAWGGCSNPASHAVALRRDGSVVEWGYSAWGAPALPPGLSYVEVAAGAAHSVARLNDGSVVAWGNFGWGHVGVRNPPALPPGVSYVQVAAGGWTSFALRSDGLVAVWGTSSYGEDLVPSLPAGLVYVEIAAGGRLLSCPDGDDGAANAVARRSDGALVYWGYWGSGSVPALPPGSSYVEIATSHYARIARVQGPAGLVSYCFGDGTDTACPCANNGTAGHGCANSVDASGALLVAHGTPSVTNDSMILLGSHMPTTASCLYFQGTLRTSAAWGDGLRCVGGSVTRLGAKINVAGTSAYGHGIGSDVDISLHGAVPLAGGTRTYQVWYRNTAAFCTPAAFNVSNGMEVSWTP